MGKIYVNIVKKPKKQLSGFHLRNYGYSCNKRKGERFVALMMALRDVENFDVVKNRMLLLSKWNKVVCYDTYTFWDELSYGDMWYLTHVCDLASCKK